MNQIAAGEVVERPASVVKELVENSLDAGATRILVEVKDGGKSLIKIVDNGKGIAKEDCSMALMRHATSKISQEEDLWRIGTLGFRGEALASIASVSKLTLRSKVRGAEFGTELECVGGDMFSLHEVGMPDGTQIEVRDLFFNTPARQKFLKQDSTEISHVSGLLTTTALAYHQVSFKLVHNGKTVFDFPAVQDSLSRIADVFGRSTADAMLPIFYGGSNFQIEGFIGKPLLARSSTKHQYFFVNKRPIQHGLLANTIKQAFHSMLMEDKKPVFMLDIKIDPAMVDVNVHPRKMEVRFVDQQSIIKIVYSAVKSALEKHSLIPKAFTESQRYMSDNFPKESNRSDLNFNEHAFVPSFSDRRPSFSYSRPAAPQDSMDFGVEQMTEFSEPKMKAVAQLSTCYIIAKSGEELILIDQHAAHERVRYEELMDQFEAQEKASQILLTPLSVELTSEEVRIIEENMEVFEALGFEINHFGGETFVVNAVPRFLASEDLDVVIKGVLDDIISGKAPTKAQGKREEILTYMSCRTAIKFGKKLEMVEMQELINQMETLKRPYTCPHGRPTMISITLEELEKMFGRK